MSSLNHLHSSTSRKRSSKNASYKSNTLLIGYGLTALAAIIIFQIFRWQILRADQFAQMANEQYSTNQTQSATRGLITASDGTVLAVDEPAWNIYATLSTDEQERELFFNHKDEFVAEVSGILNMEKATIEDKITDDFVYFSIKKNVSTDKKKALAEANIFGEGTQGFGLYFEPEEKRIYPNGELGAHVLGFIGQTVDGEPLGQYGIQGYYFGDITGSEGYTYEEKDSYGNVILTAEYEPILPRNGKDFELTIVPNLQTKVEEHLEEGVKHTRAKSGSAILMDPSTGAILAMANYPTYDPNEYWLASQSWILKNRTVSDVYEYGSVQKPITMAIALETEAIDEDYTCNDSTGYLDLYDATGYEDLKGRKVYTWNRLPSGTLDISGILGKSNNPCTARVALKTNYSAYYSMLKDFGIGEFIGIGLQEESTSYLRPFEEWTKLDIITASFGQGVSATPLQVISALSTIANDGERMRPYIISEISDESDSTEITPSVLSNPISAETAQIVQKALQKAVQNNSLGGLATELKDYDIAAKTGTAQIAKDTETGYDEEATITTAVGFAPVDDPKFIMLVKLEEPEISTYASLTAVPVWKDIFLDIADDLEIDKKN
jgi:cell division protein FtsI/penicillin-binding protein 2